MKIKIEIGLRNEENVNLNDLKLMILRKKKETEKAELIWFKIEFFEKEKEEKTTKKKMKIQRNEKKDDLI